MGYSQLNAPGHNILPPQSAKDGWFTCSCGHQESTLHGFAAHIRQVKTDWVVDL